MAEKVVYNDPTPLDSSKTYTPAELAYFIRHKIYGKDVREALAKSVEIDEQIIMAINQLGMPVLDKNGDEIKVKNNY